MSALAAATVLIPMASAGATALAWAHPRLQRALSHAGALAFLAVALMAVMQVVGGAPLFTAFGGWPQPFGIAFHLDGLAALLVGVTALMGAACLLYLQSSADAPPHRPALLPLIHGLLAGVAGSFATADLFNLYVWFEVMLVCALGLLALGGERAQLDGAFKYLVLNLFGTLLMLSAVGVVYAATGHLNYAALHSAQAALPSGLRDALVATLVLALLIKAGAFPLFAWLPAAYPSLPTAVLALFAGLLTKVGAYAVLRIVGDVFAPASSWLMDALGWLACATMLTGVLGAAYHFDLRRILAFHIISQIGYILLAVAVGGPSGNAAALFYTVHHIIVKANLFSIAGLMATLGGSFDVRRLGGLSSRTALALVFAVPALSLVGIPPLSGFWAKWMVLHAAFAQGRAAWAAIGLLVSVLTLYSMMKIWIEAFWKPRPEGLPMPSPPSGTLWPAWVSVASLAAITLAIGLQPQWLAQAAQSAARGLGLP